MRVNGTAPAFAVSIALAAAAWTGVTAGANAGDANGAEAMLETVTVTGSRIESGAMVNAGPIARIDADELLYQGTTRVEDMLRNLPQVYSTQNTGQSNSATGTATINLRNLGDARTLVLVNGRRLPAGSPIQGGIGADLNQIPGALIRRVDVLTGGASATYGSDAVAGVVNFIMIDDFEGLKLEYQFGQYNHDNDNRAVQAIVADAGYPFADGGTTDGEINNVSLIAGRNIGGTRGNVTVYGTYRKINAVAQSERDYSSCSLNGAVTECVGSGTIPEGRITNFLNPDENADDFDYKVMGDRFVPRGDTRYNFGPTNYYQRPDERYTAGLFAHYEATERVELYSELMYADDRTVAQIAPSGAFLLAVPLSCDNPLLSDQQSQRLCPSDHPGDVQDVFIGRRNVEGGPRRHDLRHTSLRGVLGARGNVNDVWRYDVYGMYGEVQMENTFLNDLSITRIGRALHAVRDADGNIVCQSVVDGSDPECVPWNIFATGAVTRDQTDYLTLPLSARGSTEQRVYSGYIAGDLGEYGVALPWANEGVEVALGAEYRKETLDFNPDAGFRGGDGAGQGGATPPVRGGWDVKGVFVEAGIPLVEDAAFAEALTLDAGYRYSDYSTGHDTHTYGVRGGWAVNDSITLRAGNQRAVRVANIRELFRPSGFNLFDMDADPCAGRDDNGDGMLDASGRTLETCARSGVTAAQFGRIENSPANQYNFLEGGNARLAPEESETWSFGVVLTPRFAPGLTLSVDYYAIEIEKGIATLNPEIILNQCLDGNATQCAKIRRSERGDLWVGSDVNDSGHIISFVDNLAIERVRGFDIIAHYTLALGKAGSLNFHNITGLIDTWEQQGLVGAPVVDCKGKWGGTCGYPTPELQNNLRVTWKTPWDVSASVLWRHIDEIDDLNAAEIDLREVNYFDLTGVWTLSDSVTLTAGAANLLDTAPPIAGANAGPFNNGNGNIFPGMYDALGRYWFARVSFRL